ncbi:MAG TPA: GNAT family N-acetyltransferase [Xanthobacteraceae bacterium]|nr:GNAT family N-acetyltransferase [Xanthobacteraceae bacterium]
MSAPSHPAARPVPPPVWRPMAAADLPAVMEIAGKVHPGYPEDEAVFAERLRLCPRGCLVAESAGAAVAYAVSHPWHAHHPPKLNTLLGALPAAPQTFYIHDIALLPAARGTGLGRAIVAQLADVARGGGLPNLSLVAVNGSVPFWRRQGFVIDDAPALRESLRSYGGDAAFMTRNLQG